MRYSRAEAAAAGDARKPYSGSSSQKHTGARISGTASCSRTSMKGKPEPLATLPEARALANLVGNGVATIVVAKWCGELDERRLKAVLAHGDDSSPPASQVGRTLPNSGHEPVDSQDQGNAGHRHMPHRRKRCGQHDESATGHRRASLGRQQ